MSGVPVRTAAALQKRTPVVLSVVLPVFNEETIIPDLYRRLTAVLEGWGESYEIIAVNDGSSDQSLSLLFDLAARDQRVKVVNFARNFGHQAAITAGLDYSRGQAVVMMDTDLQDPPEGLPDLIAKRRGGVGTVYAGGKRRGGGGEFKPGNAALLFTLLS